MTFMKISFDLIKKKKNTNSNSDPFSDHYHRCFFFIEKNDAETSLPYEENISQDNDLLATKEKIEKIDEKGSQEIIKEKLDEKKQ